jgi:hypothetical protein
MTRPETVGSLGFFKLRLGAGISGPAHHLPVLLGYEGLGQSGKVAVPEKAIFVTER